MKALCARADAGRQASATVAAIAMSRVRPIIGMLLLHVP
jgi:hypothetical protein